MTHGNLRYGLYASAVVTGVLLIAAVQPRARDRHQATTVTATTPSSSEEPFRPLQPWPANGAAHALELARRMSPPSSAPDAASEAEAVETALEPRPTLGGVNQSIMRATRLRPSMVRDLADRCAPTAPSSVLASIVQVESGRDPLRIGVNGPRHQVYSPTSQSDAVALARQLIGQGESIDLGLAQINSRNLPDLGLSVERVFDPCVNLAAAATMINRGYAAALRAGEPNRPILQMAYSIYNSGDGVRGIANGYAAKVEAARRTRE